jgi:hypothetical protein
MQRPFEPTPDDDLETTMQQPTRPSPPPLGTVCQNCDAPSTRLATIVRFRRSGDRIHLVVCAFCYLRLGPKGRRRYPR